MIEYLKRAHVLIERNPRRLWVHYVVALTILLGFLTANHLLQIRMIEDQVVQIEQVDVSGQQTMLSQRIALLSRDYFEIGSPELARDLRQAIVLFRANNAILAELAAGSERLSWIYLQPGGQAVEALSASYASLAEDVLRAPPGSEEGRAALTLLNRQGQGPLLDRLEVATDAFVFEDAPHSAAFATYIRIGFMTMVAMILFLGLAVFLPAHRLVVRSFMTLEERNRIANRKNAKLRDYAKSLAFSALHDTLTGLANRRSLHEKLAHLLRKHRDGEEHVCVFHLDLDGFKQLNDDMGHPAGDAALKQVAKLMQDSVRQTDIVARIGGDEFVVVSVFSGDKQEEQAQALGEKLIALISKPMVHDGADLRVGASVGYAFATLPDIDIATLSSHADLALYEAKRNGKGIARQFEGDLQETLNRRKTIVTEIEASLLEGRFIPYFQPLLCADTGTVLGLEMLIRWDHPTEGMLTPSSFLDVAENAGLLDAIDARVQIDGLEALADMRDQGWNVPRLALNASTRTIQYKDYVERLVEALDVHGFDPRDVIIQVKEDTLIADRTDQAVRTISALRTSGFNVYVDNFGTGYSSLSTLSRLDVNGLKIDRDLIADIEDPKVRQVVSAVVGMSRALSMTVVAEGVETAAQFKHIKALGVDAVQGFQLAEPMPLSEALDWLSSYGQQAQIAG